MNDAFIGIHMYIYSQQPIIDYNSRIQHNTILYNYQMTSSLILEYILSRHVISNERPQASSSILHVETKYIPISNEKSSYNCFIANYENSVTFGA